jgi:hypothetical protein
MGLASWTRIASFGDLRRLRIAPLSMDLDRTIAVLNDMEHVRVITRYAIGGAVAAFFYIEPGTTYDLDIFIAWEPPGGASGIVTFGPIYAYLRGRGYDFHRDAMVVEGWPVQFLPPGTDLVKQALDASVCVEIKGVKTRVFTQEYLMAICLETGRPKDLARLVQFVEEDTHDTDAFLKIVDSARLRERWERFKSRFLSPL